MTGMKKLLRWSMILSMGLVVFCSFAQAAEKRSLPVDPNKLVEAAKKEGQLVIVASASNWGGVEGVKALEKAFNKKHGYNFSIEFVSGPDIPTMTSRIFQEYKAGQPSTTDLFLGTEQHIPRLAAAGALYAYPWSKVFPNITDEMVAMDGTGIARQSHFPGVAYNTNLVKPNEVPKQLEDLLAPKWKGKIASTPYAGTFDRMATELSLGYEKTKNFVTRFAKQVSGLIRDGDTERVSSGEFTMLAMSSGDHNTIPLSRKGAPISFAILEDVSMIGHYYLSVPVYAVHPNLATLFAAFLLTKEGQQIMWEQFAQVSHLVEGTAKWKEVQDIKKRGSKFAMFTPEWVAKHQNEADKYREEFVALLRQGG